MFSILNHKLASNVELFIEKLFKNRFGFLLLIELEKMNKDKNISIILPVLNESENLEYLIPEFTNLLSNNLKFYTKLLLLMMVLQMEPRQL